MTDDDWWTLLIVAVCVALVAASIGAVAMWGPIPTVSVSSHSPDSASLDEFDTASITGENVTVGVIDATGFDTEHPTLNGHVTATHAFGSEPTVRNRGQNDHGTAAAATVNRVAPNASLVLATFDSPRGFRDAVNWMVESDVDVIVAPVSFLGTAGDGSSLISRVATRATLEGVVFVASAGNLARGHWSGQYDTVRNGTLQFGADRRLYLSGDDRRITVWLSWPERFRSQDYTAELYRTGGGQTTLIARSQPYHGDNTPNERFVVRTRPGGIYHVVVRGPQNATHVPLELSSPTHDFRQPTPSGSLTAPATAHGVLTVGALDPNTGRLEPFSSRGPTSDGRLGVDVVAPDRGVSPTFEGRFIGSSVSAPYAGGVTALVLSVDPDQSPREVEVLLEQTATDIGKPNADPATGYGKLNPTAAVRAAVNETNGTAQTDV
ncbi:S8 family serine peptidase [Halogeometricum borinquense]|uniref:S8 family serine peptidase n=1 Tax=Halogeometricum borinquense TaxID=60847 RepID=A0A6C0UJA7_9EURY|nr:S8 family serine peptidase [Halogeometricum borinquense]QIB75280.1 S8 family serine peptidase [Halogeometricum borinquense]QIQ75774.1 S8 family serine peptidase [Halogeometricum borinquense]